MPTVALGIQQLKAISSQIPNFQARLLSGADNVDYWTEQWIWDEVLRDIRIVVSTHQVWTHLVHLGQHLLIGAGAFGCLKTWIYTNAAISLDGF